MKTLKSLFIISILTTLLLSSCDQSKKSQSVENPLDTMAFRNPDLPIATRVIDLISRMTVEEKISQLMHSTPAIERLGILPYNWWSEACHGVARNGNATVFPQPIGMAASFDSSLIRRVGIAISDEARAKFNEAQKIGNYGQYAGLTFWAPNINIFRDPRWGRGMETFGEDPYLMSLLGVSFVKGMQGNTPGKLKTAACAKHYVVHSGPESQRHTFNALPNKKDFYETYTPAFKALVQQANVEAVMCAYNRTYNEPCCGSKYLMQDVLRNEFGFKGHIVTDCGAIYDFTHGHKTEPDMASAAAKAIQSGVNLNCGDEFKNLKIALEQNKISEADIDSALMHLLPTRFKLGLFDPPSMNPYQHLDAKDINSKPNRQLALEAARKSMVLLKNDSNLLPLKKDIRKLFVMGPYAASAEVLLGNYHGVSTSLVTFLEGLTAKVSAGTSIEYRPACLTDHANLNTADWAGGEAMTSDAIVAVFGISNMFEGEEGETLSSNTKGDRLELELPKHQVEYLKQLRNKGNKPIILVLTGGSPISSPEIYDWADAVIFAWYPGEEGGNALADIIFGDYNPSGRLPITFPKSTNQLPPYEDYSLQGRTYRYMNEEPLYPFGYGLSYSNFSYSNLQTDKNIYHSNESIKVSLTVQNNGKFDGDEVVQLYICDTQASVAVPNHSLKGVQRLHLKAGESKTVNFTINPEMFHLVNTDGSSIFEPGEFTITIAGASPMPISKKLGVPIVSSQITINQHN